MQAAEECFARSGFQATSMDEVIAAAGMSSSTVYRYFPEGKRSLMREVLARRMGPLVERIKQLAESEALPDFEQGFIEALVLLNYEPPPPRGGHPLGEARPARMLTTSD